MQNANYHVSSRPEMIGERRRLSWGAIIAGTVAALSIQLLLTLLGMAIGLWTVPAVSQEFMQGLGIGAAIWGLLSFIIALYCGGWIAGRMSGIGDKFDGLLEGFTVWGLVTVITFMLLTTTIGGIVGGAAGLAGEAMAMAVEQVEDPAETAEEYAAPARDALEDIEIEREDVEDVAVAGGMVFFGAFLSLLLGAIAASLAGRQGSLSGLRAVTVGTTPTKAEVKE